MDAQEGCLEEVTSLPGKKRTAGRRTGTCESPVVGYWPGVVSGACPGLRTTSSIRSRWPLRQRQ